MREAVDELIEVLLEPLKAQCKLVAGTSCARRTGGLVAEDVLLVQQVQQLGVLLNQLLIILSIRGNSCN